MGIRKYWIGVSSEDAHRPDNYETFLAFDEDCLQDVQATIAEWMADEFLNEEGEEE